MKDENTFELMRPFGPPVGKFPIPSKICDEINQLVDSHNKGDRTGLEYFGDHLAGEIASELLIPPHLMLSTGLEAHIIRCIKGYVMRSLNKPPKKVHIETCWIVQQMPGEYNPIHWHSFHLSGAGWLKLPEKMEQGFKTDRFDGKIVFIHGSKQFLSDSDYIVKPEIGLLTVFPNYLMHQVYPFRGLGERRSIAFNATIDDELYNVYGA